MRKVLLILFLFVFFHQVNSAELTIVYTGNTFGALYSVREKETLVGGLTRRSTLIKELQKERKNLLLIDAGNFSAGSSFDEFSISYDLDRRRTLLYLKAIKKMGYEVVGIGEAELLWGKEFFKKLIRESGLDFVSSNLSWKNVKPFLIKKKGKLKIGILGIVYTSSFDFERVKAQLRKYLVLFKKKKVNFTVLLSSLREDLNVKIAEEFNKDINLIISSGFGVSTSPLQKIGKVVLVKSFYQGKSVGVIDWAGEKDNLVLKEFKEKRITSEIAEDEEIKKIIPACFSDKDCYLKKQIPCRCRNPATSRAVCVPKNVIEVWVIEDKDCPFLSTITTEKFLKRFSSLWKFSHIDYREEKAQRLIRRYHIKTLPAFILPSLLEEKAFFSALSKFMRKEKDKYLLKEEISGINIFLEREFLPAKVDLFFHLQDRHLHSLLKMVSTVCEKERYKLNLHLIVSPTDTQELKEEVERMIAIKNLYPQKFFSYLLERVKRINSSWWISLLEKEGIDFERIREFVEKEKYGSFLKKEKELQKELKINRGVAILVNNRFLFQLVEPSYSDLKKLLEYAKKEE
ncbi:MAG: hypothetical protein B6D55_00715 [Candidatus Omnitrophica bacterium 4484_70.2]|nr:MAG: hypothetical protein B6D55_00715 [Candidatus Omnitrophica bacterium 4484_70.2]